MLRNCPGIRHEILLLFKLCSVIAYAALCFPNHFIFSPLPYTSEEMAPILCAALFDLFVICNHSELFPLCTFMCSIFSAIRYFSEKLPFYDACGIIGCCCHICFCRQTFWSSKINNLETVSGWWKRNAPKVSNKKDLQH